MSRKKSEVSNRTLGLRCALLLSVRIQWQRTTLGVSPLSDNLRISMYFFALNPSIGHESMDRLARRPS